MDQKARRGGETVTDKSELCDKELDLMMVAAEMLDRGQLSLDGERRGSFDELVLAAPQMINDSHAKWKGATCHRSGSPRHQEVPHDTTSDHWFLTCWSAD
jgi:hypothetical protein